MIISPTRSEGGKRRCAPRRKLIRNLYRPPRGADLAMEVVSPGKASRKRDLREKRREYAKAKIEEYWIVDPQERNITVLSLQNGKYRVHGAFVPGEQATSLS